VKSELEAAGWLAGGGGSGGAAFLSRDGGVIAAALSLPRPFHNPLLLASGF